MGKKTNRGKSDKTCRDNEFFIPSAEIYGEEVKKEKFSDREIYQTNEFHATAQNGRGEYHTVENMSTNADDGTQTGDRPNHSSRKLARRMQYFFTAACCVAVIAVSTPKTGTAEVSVEMSEESFEETEAVPFVETGAEEEEEKYSEDNDENPSIPDTLELSSEEVEFLNQLWTAIDADDMETMDAMRSSDIPKQITRHFLFNHGDGLYSHNGYDEIYVYTDGEARRIDLVDGEALFIDSNPYNNDLLVCKSYISNSTLDGYGKWFRFNSYDSYYYKGIFADSTFNGEGEYCFDAVSFTENGSKLNVIARFTGDFRDGYLYNGEFSRSSLTGTITDGVVVHSMNTYTGIENTEVGLTTEELVWQSPFFFKKYFRDENS
ncbi:MAG: hypothetical protein LIO81_06800 [Clostridiales bacterium]|nr:hypothetical protein [Clostridiales bacterium]